MAEQGPKAYYPKGHRSATPAAEPLQGILAQIVRSKRAEVAELAARREELEGRARQGPSARPFRAALRRPGEVALLAEIKPRSPSAGEIRPGADPVEIARDYQRGAAAALSVLTDAPYFGGSLDALAAVRPRCTLPLLRKDFVIDPLQLLEARAAGADAVLLIARILDDPGLEALLAGARALGMDALVEVHDTDELERALAAGADLVGINNRDLETFRTDLATTLRLAADVPPEVTLVAESGIRGPEDVDRVGAVGVEAVLVGEALMRAADVAAAAARLTGRPRAER